MKRILNILLCVVIVAGITSCGNRSSKKTIDESGLSSKEKKELKQFAKKVKVRLEEKKDKIIKWVDSPLGANTTTYTFDGDKCIGYEEITTFKDAKAAKEAYDGLKEVNDFSHTLKTLKVDGNVLTWEYSQKNVDLMFSDMTRKQILEQVKEEIKQTKEFLK